MVSPEMGCKYRSNVDLQKIFPLIYGSKEPFEEIVTKLEGSVKSQLPNSKYVLCEDDLLADH